MKFGLFLSPQYPVGDSMVHRFRDVLQQVRAARDSGFDLVSAGQHYLSDPYQMLQTIPLLARLSADAGEMQVAATVILLPLLNPVDVAEQSATLDVICGGRFILGVGLGYRDEEYVAFGVDKSQRISRFLEALTIIKSLWTQEEIEFQGKHFQILPTRIVTRPEQKPHPPIWIAANADAAVARAGHLGYPWLMSPHTTGATLEKQVVLYRQAIRETGHALPQDLPLVRELYVADNRKVALAESTPYLQEKYAAYTAWGQDKALPGNESFCSSFDDLIRDRFVIGSPLECVEDLQMYVDRLGITHVLLRIQWAGMPNDLVLRQIDLLGSKVIPHFK